MSGRVYDPIRENYSNRAANASRRGEREHQRAYDLKSFNNWIKSVLIAQTTKKMCFEVQAALDLRKSECKLLHVLEVGCGRGQDLSKWRRARVNYMVAFDFSEQCIIEYKKRWGEAKEKSAYLYELNAIVGDFTNPQLFHDIDHTFYDVVSAQFCLHYMFSTEDSLRTGLASILNNLLDGGYFIATIPDAYTILKKVTQRGTAQSDGSITYGNSFFSMRFTQTHFAQPYGNEYGFYLENALGSKSAEGVITYTKEWLIELDNLQGVLNSLGVQIQYTCNFLEYYLKYREEYMQLFSAFGLIFRNGECMSPELWDIVHCYRVLVCKKINKGKKVREFNLEERAKTFTKKGKKRDYYAKQEENRSSSKKYNRQYK